MSYHGLSDLGPLILIQITPNELTHPKGRFTRYDFVAYDKLATGLRHELFRVNQTYNSLTTVVYVKKIVVGF